MNIGDIPSQYARQTDTTESLVRISNLEQNLKTNADDEKLRQATKDFEALFIKQMLSSMRKTVTKSGLIDGGFAESVYEDMLYDEYAQKMAATSKFGIAEMLYKQMSSYV